MLLTLLGIRHLLFSFFFFFNDTATTEIYTLSLHDALPIWGSSSRWRRWSSSAATSCRGKGRRSRYQTAPSRRSRSEEHTSELQSQSNLVCRLLLEKKKTTKSTHVPRIQETEK